MAENRSGLRPEAGEVGEVNGEDLEDVREI